MGWSHSSEAGKVLSKLEKICREQTGSSNAFILKKKKYFFEILSEDQDDAGIKGFVSDFDTGERLGGFHIIGGKAHGGISIKGDSEGAGKLLTLISEEG